ncbi:MAG: hypothetical protein ACRDY0_05415 [Acidimicrobiales bacterium]
MTDPQHLQHLLDLLDGNARPDDPPVWAHARGELPQTLVVVDEDLDRLFGWTAPADCWAVGVVAGGTAHPLPPDPPETEPGSRRVSVACVVGRDGQTVGRLCHGAGQRSEEPPASGRLLDALQRCFGLSTAPPERSSAELLSLMWLSEVLVACQPEPSLYDRAGRACRARRSPRPGAALDWEAVARLHPAVRALVGDGGELAVDHLDSVLLGASHAWSWERLRQLAASGGQGPSGPGEEHGDDLVRSLMTSDLAAWMDEGMFSRCVLDGSVPIDKILAVARRGLAPAVGDRLVRCLDATGVPVRATCA